MDFKSRFEGKTSHITKDGLIDNMMMPMNSVQPINKINGANSTTTSGLIYN